MPQMSTSTVSNHIFNIDGNWGTSRFHATSLTEAVQQVHFCAHENAQNAGSGSQPATNHWSLFLEIDPNRLVQVDVAPGSPHLPGMVILETKRYNVTNNKVYDVCSQVPAGTTVETILQLIIDKGHDRYVFAPVGERCRYWLWTFAWDMVEAVGE
jgi:hypothetical protein